MVGVFAGLKWRLVTSRLRATKGSARVGIIVAFVLLILLLGLVTIGLASLRIVPDIGIPIAVTVLTMQLIGWVLTPLVAFGVDETVDPARFALLPIRSQTLQRGLLICSLIGYFPIANMFLLLGVAIAIGVPWPVFPIAVVCAVVQLLLCVTLSRAASTSMSALMSSRRGRDLGMAVGLLIFVLYMGFVALVNRPADGNAVEAGVKAIGSVLQWTPPGALAVLPHLVATGQLARAAFAVGIAFAALALGWWWWAVSLRRSLTTTPSTTEGSSPAGHAREGTALGVGVGGTMRVVAGRDRVLVWRDPMRRMPWLMMALLTVGWPFLVVPGSGAVFAVALGATFCGAQAGNQYGTEGSGLWLHLQTITDRVRARGEVLGHALVAIIPSTVIIAVAITVVAVAKNDYDKIPAALGLCLGAMLGSVAAACFLSAALPYALPQSRKSLFASSVPGQKGRTFGASLGLIGGAVVVALPAAVAVLLSLTVDPVWGWVALFVGPITGVIAVLIAVNLTANRYLERGPEIFATVSAGDRV